LHPHACDDSTIGQSKLSKDRNNMLTLHQCKICVLGVTDHDEEKRIIRIIKELGGLYCSQITDDIFCAIIKKAGSHNHKKVQALKIPAVELNWLWDCRSGHIKLPLDRYLIRPFIGLVICCTGYAPEDRELIQRIVTDCGGEFSLGMRQTCTHLIAEDEDPSSKYTSAKNWRTVQIVTIQWLRECEKSKSKLIS
jgi:hypothetical protein